MSATNLNTARPEWMSAQVTVDSRSDFKIVMEGRATNGGYAVDQLVFSPGKCSSKTRTFIYTENGMFTVIQLLSNQKANNCFLTVRPKEANPNFLVSKK